MADYSAVINDQYGEPISSSTYLAQNLFHPAASGTKYRIWSLFPQMSSQAWPAFAGSYAVVLENAALGPAIMVDLPSHSAAAQH